MDRELEKTPGVLWNFSQPISDNVEEAVSGVKGELAVKIYGDDLRTLEEKGNEIVSVMSKIKGVQDLGLFRVIGQPNLNYAVNRKPPPAMASTSPTFRTRSRRQSVATLSPRSYKTKPATTLLYAICRSIRNTQEAIDNIRLLSPSGERVSLAQLTPSRRKMAQRRSTAKAVSATSPSSTVFVTETSARPSKRPSAKSKTRSNFPPATRSIGPASMRARNDPRED